MADAEFTTSRGELPRSPSARSAPPTEESLELLRLVLRALARRRRLVVRIASAVLVLTALITVVSSRVYVARATIQISQDRPVLGGAPELSLFMRQVDPITSEVEILRSRSNAEEVVRRLLLRIEIESAPKGEWRFSRFEFGKLETLRARKVELELEDARRRIEESLARSDGDGAWERIEARRKGYQAEIAELERKIAAETRRVERLADYRGELTIRFGSKPGELELFDEESNRLGRGSDWRFENEDFAFEIVPPEEAREKGLAQGEKLTFAIARERTATASLLRRMKVEPRGRTNVVEIVVEAPSAEEASLTANTLVDVYLERARSIRAEQAAQRKSFIKGQVDVVEANLHAAEREVSDYKSGNALIALDDQAAHLLEPWTQNEVELARTQSALVEARALLEKLERVGADASVPLLVVPVGLPGSSTVTTLMARLTGLEVERKQLLAGRRADHPDVQRVTAEIRSARDQLVHELEGLIAGLEERERSLRSVVESFKTEIRKLPAEQLGLAHRILESTVNADLYSILRREYAQAEIAEASTLSNAWPVDRAIEPLRPSRPRVIFNLAAGLFFGAFLAVAIALLKEYFDRSVRTTDQLERLGLGAFGVIPRIELDRRARTVDATGGATSERRTPRLLYREGIPGLIVEAYRSLRTNIRFAMERKESGCFAFTSAAPAEGKSLTTANLAISLAQSGARVLLVDADLRRPRLAKVFGERSSSRKGLSDVLAGSVPWREVAFSSPVEGLDLLAGGRVPPNPSDLLASAGFADLLADFRSAGYDFVLVDTPPLLPFTDAAVAARSLDGVFLVVRAGRTSTDAVRRSVQVLESAGARIAGAILNDVAYEEMFGIGSYVDYYSYYLDEDAEDGRWHGMRRYLRAVPLWRRLERWRKDSPLPAWARPEATATDGLARPEGEERVSRSSSNRIAPKSSPAAPVERASSPSRIPVEVEPATSRSTSEKKPESTLPSSAPKAAGDAKRRRGKRRRRQRST